MALLALLTTSCAGAGPSTSPTSGSATDTAGASTTPPASSASPGVWKLLPPAPLTTPVFGVTAAWDGKEVFLTGRVCPGSASAFTETVAYNPVTGAWRKLPAFPGPKACVEGQDNAFWDGTELLLIGVTNAAYTPSTNTWRKLPPGGRGSNAELTAWTGRQTLGFGGGCCGEALAMVRSFTPGTGSWSDPPAGPLGGRQGVIGVWDGRQLIAVGGSREEPNGFQTFGDAASYDPATGTWSHLAPLPAPRQDSPAVWDGTDMLVVGGERLGPQGPHRYPRGLSFDPSTDRWVPLPRMAYPRTGAAAVWTGSRMLVWGGGTIASGGKVAPPHGEAFDPATDRWSALPMSPLQGRDTPVAVWTGSQMFVWGGATPGGTFLYDGAVYTPGTP